METASLNCLVYPLVPTATQPEVFVWLARLATSRHLEGANDHRHVTHIAKIKIQHIATKKMVFAAHAKQIILYNLLEAAEKHNLVIRVAT